MVPDLFHFFKGQWLFERTISDALSGDAATASGKAMFTAEDRPGALFYKEEGKLYVQGAAAGYPFFRHYRYFLHQEEMNVYFADAVTGNNGLYQSYRYDPASGLLTATAGHQCRRDLYTGEYRIMTPAIFCSKTIVAGPKKDYTLDTLYTRTGI